jgi:uncharacterized membrane protein HdeD (DUF308 family)
MLDIVTQVRAALQRRNRLATTLGALRGAIVPLAAFIIAHVQIDRSLTSWGGLAVLEGFAAQPIASALVFGALLYSAPKVYHWARASGDTRVQAIGFTTILEGAMTLVSIDALSYVALAYLIAINAVSSGTTLAMTERAARAAAIADAARDPAPTPAKKPALAIVRPVQEIVTMRRPVPKIVASRVVRAFDRKQRRAA